MKESIAAFLGTGAGVVFGFFLGVLANSDVWEKDCEATGFHRSDSKVFQCKQVKA